MSYGFDELKRAYKLVFTLPQRKLLAVVILLLTSACLLLANATNSLDTFIKAAAVAAVTVLIAKAVDKAIVTWKRAGGLYAVFLASSLATLSFRGNVFSGVALECLLAFLLLATSSGFLRAALLPLSCMVLTGLATGGSSPGFPAAIAAYVLAVWIALKIIDRRVMKATGASGTALLRGFLRYILAGEKSNLEEVFSTISTERVLKLHIFDFESYDNSRLGRVVVSEIHPGPFRDLGSSSLPSEVILSHGDLPVLFLKAPSTHGENLAFSCKVRELVGKILELERPSAYSTRASLGLATRGKFRVVTLSFDHSTLVFIDPLVPMEDLPYSLSATLSNDKIVTVDTHSMIAESYDAISGQSINLAEHHDILAAISDAVSNPLEEGKFRAAFRREDYSDGVSVAPGGISCAVIEIGSVKLGLVSIDANNVSAEFKPLLLSKMQSYVDVPVVASTDTHLLTGRVAGVEYYPAGSVIPVQLLTACLKCIDQAVRELKEARVGYTPLPFKSWFLSENSLKEISRVTKGNMYIGISLIALATVLSALTALL